MRTAFLAATWVFVFCVAAEDGRFAWQNRQELADWELNPLAAWMGSALGVQALLGFKATGLVFAFVMAAYCRSRGNGIGKWLTAVAGAVYLLLFLHYSINRLPICREASGIPSSRLYGAPSSISDKWTLAPTFPSLFPSER